MIDELRATPEVLYGAAIALLIVVLLTPAVGGMARLLGVVDRPDARRLNRRPIPRLGGLAIFLGILVPSLAFLDLSGEMRGILLGAAVATRRRRGRRLPRPVAVAEARRPGPRRRDPDGVRRLDRPLHASRSSAPSTCRPWIGVPLTIVWIVAVMNMVNFLDGLDGLAAGVCAISGVTFAVIALSLGKADAAVLSAIVAGACIGFLRHNFFPARIFMGDSGALVLGFTLASVSVAGLLKTASTVVLFLPLLVLAVPIIDTSFVVAEAAEVPPADLRRRPQPPPPPLPQHRLLAAAGRADDVGLDGVARGAPRSRRASSRSARAASGTPGRRSPSSRSRSSRSRSRSTSSTCSRSSSSRTRGCGGAKATSRRRARAARRPDRSGLARLARSTKSASASLKSGMPLGVWP